MDIPEMVKRECRRSGHCCTVILLDHHPRQLRDSYRNWRDSIPNTVRYEGIELIFPMLEGRCRGKMRNGAKWKYVYGPCKHLVASDATKVASCSIHADRPSVCKGYPYYNAEQSVMMGLSPPDVNPGYVKGCGYNESVLVGKTIREYTTDLLPLEKDEE